MAVHPPTSLDPLKLLTEVQTLILTVLLFWYTKQASKKIDEMSAVATPALKYVCTSFHIINVACSKQYS